SEASLRPGDGSVVLKKWQMTHNWREIVAPRGDSLDEKAWVPLGKQDVRRDKIDLNRDPKSPDYLRPARSSPLATSGAGQTDPGLPSYVGALPPGGVEPWDWDRTWRMPAGAKLLTISQRPDKGGKYRSLGAALQDVTPWATLRILDAATYEETITLDDPKRF